MGRTRRSAESDQRITSANDEQGEPAATADESGREAGTGAAMKELHDQVLVSLRRIIRASDINSRKLGKETGLTTPQIVVMSAIRQRGMTLASEVARNVSLSQATVTNILNRLESHGLIARERSDQDKRRVNVSLTKEGETLLDTAPQPLQESFIERFGALEPWEQHQLVASLERLASLMDAEHIDASPFLTASEEMH